MYTWYDIQRVSGTRRGDELTNILQTCLCRNLYGIIILVHLNFTVVSLFKRLVFSNICQTIKLALRVVNCIAISYCCDEMTLEYFPALQETDNNLDSFFFN